MLSSLHPFETCWFDHDGREDIPAVFSRRKLNFDKPTFAFAHIGHQFADPLSHMHKGAGVEIDRKLVFNPGKNEPLARLERSCQAASAARRCAFSMASSIVPTM